MKKNDLERFPNALDAERKIVSLGDSGRVSFYVARQESGTPLLLLHSINAAPSSMEMRPLFDAYRDVRPVYSLDLPGFGASERTDREYSAAFFSETIDRFIRESVGEHCDVIALSLSGEFVARAVSKFQTPIRSLTLISPTGLTDKRMPGSDNGGRISNFLRLPLVGSNLFKLLTTRPSIRYFLGQLFDGSAPPMLVDYAIMTARHPAARFAPFSFVSGKLFDPDAIRNLYDKVREPVLVLYDQDPNISFEKLPELVNRKTNWREQRIVGSKGLPQWTHLDATTAALDDFWSSLTADQQTEV